MAKQPARSDEDLKAHAKKLSKELRTVQDEIARRNPPPFQNITPKIGGSFASELGPEDLHHYQELANEASPMIAEIMLSLCDMVKVFQETPESTAQGSPHPSGVGIIVPLHAQEVKRIDSVVPYEHELEMYAKLFDGIDPVRNRDLRNAAFHLLWYATELNRDREPMTVNKIPPGLLRSMK